MDPNKQARLDAAGWKVGADVAGAAAARQAAYTILTTLGTLGNTGGAGWLHNDGSGVLAWTTPPAGTGTVTSVTSGTGLTATTNPITVSGTISVTGPLLTLTNLADAAGWLHSTGANVFAWSTPTKTDVGLGNVTNDAQAKAGLATASGLTMDVGLVGRFDGGVGALQKITVGANMDLSAAGILSASPADCNTNASSL